MLVARLAQAQEARRLARRSPRDAAAQAKVARAQEKARAAQAEMDRLHARARMERDGARPGNG